MKLYNILARCAIVGILPACASQGSSDCTNSNQIDESFRITAPDAIPGSLKMATVIGPIAPNLSKWGPDNENLPFSWPGRALQKEPTFPGEPSEQLIYEVRLPENSSLHKVHVWVDPVNDHDKVPDSRTQSMIWVHNGGMVESEVIASVQTMGDSVANYEQRYLLTMELDEPYRMTADTRVFIYVFGEWGGGALPGLAVDTPEIAFGE